MESVVPIARARGSTALMVATGMALGLAMPMGKLAGEAGVGALSFALVPAGGAALVLGVLAWCRHGRPHQLARLMRFGAVAGLLGHAIPNSMTAWFSHSAGAGFTGLAYTLPPVFTLGLLLALQWERWQPLRALAVALGLSGAVWLVGARVHGGQLTGPAALLVLAVPLAVAAGNLFRARCLPSGIPPLWMGAATAACAFAWLLPSWALAPSAFNALSPDGTAILALQVLVAAAGLGLFFQLQLRSEPVTMSFVGYVIALTAVVSGALLFGERLPLKLLPAALLIAAGYWLVQRTAAPRQPIQ